MSQKDREHYAKIKADPVKYAAYLERKRRERKGRPEYQRKRKAAWRAAHPETADSRRKANHAVDAALRDGIL